MISVSKQLLFGTAGVPLSTPASSTLAAIDHVKKLGLDCLEVEFVKGTRMKNDTAREIGRRAEEAGIRLSVHAPYYINLNAYPEEWPKSRKRLMDAAHFGHLAGATDIIFHPGSYFLRPAEEVLQTAIPRLKGCVEELRRAGNPVRLRPEVMGKSAMLGSLEDVLSMAHEVEGVEPCLDFAHLHALPGDGSMNAYEEWKRVLTRYRRVLGAASLKRLHCHLSGIEYTSKGERKHLMLAESDFDLSGLMRALAELKCGGRIVCESPVMDEDARLIQRTWEQSVRKLG